MKTATGLSLAILALTSTLWSEGARATSCEGGFVPLIAIASHIPRVTKSRLTTDPCLFVEGDEALTHAAPARVITRDGEDYLLAIDARRAFEMGARAFATQILGVSTDPATRTWLDRFEARFTSYLNEDLVAKRLTSLWADAAALRTIDQVFFLRFFSPTLEINRSHRSGTFESADQAARIALVSLRPPRGEESQPSSRPPEPEFKSISSLSISAAKSPRLPERIWFQLPPDGKARYVTWSVPGRTAPRNNKDFGATKIWFERQLRTIAPAKWARTGGDTVHLAYFNYRSVLNRNTPNLTGLVYQLQRRIDSRTVTFDIVGEAIATTTELLNLSADFTERFLEPAHEVEPTPYTLRFPSQIFLPMTALETMIETDSDRLKVAGVLGTLNAVYPDLATRLHQMGKGNRLHLRVAGQHFTLSDGITRYSPGLSLIFYRGMNDRIYVLSYLQTGATDAP